MVVVCMHACVCKARLLVSRPTQPSQLCIAVIGMQCDFLHDEAVCFAESLGKHRFRQATVAAAAAADPAAVGNPNRQPLRIIQTNMLCIAQISCRRLQTCHCCRRSRIPERDKYNRTEQ